MKNTSAYKPIVLSIKTDSIRETVEKAITAAGLKFVHTNPVALIKFDLTDTIAFLETGTDIAYSVMAVHEHYRHNNLQDTTHIIVIITDDMLEKNQTLGMWHIAGRAAVMMVFLTSDLKQNMLSLLKFYTTRGLWV